MPPRFLEPSTPIRASIQTEILSLQPPTSAPKPPTSDLIWRIPGGTHRAAPLAPPHRSVLDLLAADRGRRFLGPGGGAHGEVEEESDFPIPMGLGGPHPRHDTWDCHRCLIDPPNHPNVP